MTIQQATHFPSQTWQEAFYWGGKAASCHRTERVSNGCLLEFCQVTRNQSSSKKKKKKVTKPAASHHRGSASAPSATHRAHAMRAPPPFLVGSRRSPATRSAVRVCGHLFKTTKVKPHKGGFKNRLFPPLRSPLLSLSAFVSPSHFVCSCRVSVINLHQIKSSEELAKALKRGPHSSQALDKAFGELRRGAATGPL